jgi:hypothetical protein
MLRRRRAGSDREQGQSVAGGDRDRCHRRQKLTIHRFPLSSEDNAHRKRIIELSSLFDESGFTEADGAVVVQQRATNDARKELLNELPHDLPGVDVALAMLPPDMPAVAVAGFRESAPRPVDGVVAR